MTPPCYSSANREVNLSLPLELKRPLVFLDLETTGLDVETSRIVEIGLVRLDPDGTRQTLVERVDPGVDIPEAAAKVHGIRTEDVRGLFGKPPLSQVGNVLVDFLADHDLAGFNCIAFDLPLLRAEFRRHAIPCSLEGRRVIDAKLIFNATETGWDRFLMGPRDLTAAVRHFCGRDLEGAHSAGADAEATIDVLMAQLERHPELPRDVAGLHEFCRNVARKRSDGLEAAP